MTFSARFMQMLVGGISALAVTAVNASFTVYTSQTDFLNAVSFSGTDTFDDTFNQSGITRSAGDYTYSASAGPGSRLISISPDPTSLDNGAMSTSGSSIRLSFSSGVVYGVSGNFFPVARDPLNLATRYFEPGTISLSIFSDPDFLFQNVTSTSLTAGSFFGVVSSAPINSINIQRTGGSLFPAVDNLTLASVSPVPEPATWALMLVGLAAVATRSRRLQ